MTLPSSGALAVSTISAEIDNTTSTTRTLGSDVMRWLSDQSTGDVAMSDFYSKTSIKAVDSRTIGAGSGNMTFTGVNFGQAFSRRLLVAITGLYAAGAEALDVTSVTIAGNATAGNDAGSFGAGGPTAGAGMFYDINTSSTSGTVVVNHGGTRTAGALIMLSVSGNSGTSTDLEPPAGSYPYANPTASISPSALTIPANGLVLACECHALTSDASWTNATKLAELNFGAANLSVAVVNRLGAGSRTLGVSWAGSTYHGYQSRSFTQSA